VFVKPFEWAGFVPKYMETGIHFATETEGYKEAQGLLEKYQVSEAALKKGFGINDWDSMRGDKYDWLTGELIQRAGEGAAFRDISGYAGVKIKESKYNVVFQELERMGLHVTKPQRYWSQFKGKDLGLDLTPEQFSEYNRLMGSISIEDKNGNKRNLIETLYQTMLDLDTKGNPKKKAVYHYNSREKYPQKLAGSHVGGPAEKVKAIQNVITKFREAAKDQLVRDFPGLEEVIRYRINQVARNKNSKTRKTKDPQIFPPIIQRGYKEHWATNPEDNPTNR